MNLKAIEVAGVLILAGAGIYLLTRPRSARAAVVAKGPTPPAVNPPAPDKGFWDSEPSLKLEGLPLKDYRNPAGWGLSD